MINSQKTKILEDVFDKHFKKIDKFFYYKLNAKPIHKDLTSETFLRFAEKIKQGEKIDNYKAFLYGIARIVFLEYLKDKYEDINLDIDEIDFFNYVQQTEKNYEDESKLNKLARKYIPKLPEKQKRVLQLRLIKKYSLSEICEIIGKDMNYIKTTQKRGIKNLRKYLTKDFR